MSYITLIPKAELLNYTSIDNCSSFLESLKEEFFPANAFEARLIKNKIFSCDFVIEEELLFGLMFEDCYFKGSMIFHNSILNKVISLNRCYIDEDLAVTRQSNLFKAKFSLINISVKHKVNIGGGNFQDCYWSFLNETEVYIHGGNFKNLIIGYWGGSTISTLTLELDKVEGLINISHFKTKINTLYVLRPAFETNLTLENFSVNNFSIYDYRNEKGLRISNVKAFSDNVASEFSISESYLGKAEFYSTDFTLFDSFKLLDVHLVDCSFVNIKWPKHIYALKGKNFSTVDEENNLELKIDQLENKKYENTIEKHRLENDKQVISYYEKKREVLRQLKYSLSKQGDVVNEQKFHSLEMRAYEKVLTYEGDFWTKYIIKFSFYFSDFGQSISRPIVGLLCIHFILFANLVVFGVLAPLQFSIDHPTSDGCWKGVHEYVRLINPFRKIEDTFEGGFIIIDVIMRIWSSYMIYNIIRASRRFIK